MRSVERAVAWTQSRAFSLAALNGIQLEMAAPMPPFNTNPRYGPQPG
ncbi:hypothetical protein WQQ_19190 [Hydrocarboniphaga effusa AP103]|uniref:Uncharacterized protein n=1 Tax=Hydrocarboniphaga effusa AP103 TaxID=1172194 RepID=I7ZJ41_9GAMM|nr:hypothetical protein WQQ_19190 [Hydrocarboniphaga effusa AP103]